MYPEIRKALQSLELFSEILNHLSERPDQEFERLLDGYIDLRRSLASQFRLIAQEYLLRGESVMEATRKQIEARMRVLFGGRIAERHFGVRGYKGVHSTLLQYLFQHADRPVSATKLRVLTSDQIHTERRVRDLRELGFSIEWRKISDDDQYVLRLEEFDLDRAAFVQVSKNIKADKTLSKHARGLALGVIAGLQQLQ